MHWKTLPQVTNKVVVPEGNNNTWTGIEMKECIGVTIHNTGNPTAGALSHAKWMQSVEDKDQQKVGVHFFVDDKDIVETLPFNMVSWHAGDGGGSGNYKTISIELCENGDYEKTLQNTEELLHLLAKEFDYTLKVYKHQDWSGKYCPRVILNKGDWEEVKKRFEHALNPYIPIKFDQKIYEVQGFNDNGTTYVALRDLVETLDIGRVEWDDKEKIVEFYD